MFANRTDRMDNEVFLVGIKADFFRGMTSEMMRWQTVQDRRRHLIRVYLDARQAARAFHNPRIAAFHLPRIRQAAAQMLLMERRGKSWKQMYN